MLGSLYPQCCSDYLGEDGIGDTEENGVNGNKYHNDDREPDGLLLSRPAHQAQLGQAFPKI